MSLRSLLGLLVCAVSAQAYSVLSHEAVVDAEWSKHIQPILERRFGPQTADALREARSYAYGGCLIQDMGYYPLSRRFFSDLVHYVRTGDFVEALIRDAQDANGLAFALGAMAHYSSDNTGHDATNRSVAILYPKQRRKFGNVIRYAQFPIGHMQVEFSFDVVQVERGKYANEALHDFIGFQIDKKLLEQAFRETYGFELKDIFASLDLSLGTYRFTVSSLIPEMTKVALALHQKDLKDRHPYVYTRRQFEKDYGSNYERPGWFARLLAWIFRAVPKVGPLRAFSFRPPTPEVEKLFYSSFDATAKRYSGYLSQLPDHDLQLPNTNLDDGKKTVRGEYILTDETYEKLARKLADLPPNSYPEAVRADVLRFFREPAAGKVAKRGKSDWKKTEAALQKLSAAPGNALPHDSALR